MGQKSRAFGPCFFIWRGVKSATGAFPPLFRNLFPASRKVTEGKGGRAGNAALLALAGKTTWPRQRPGARSPVRRRTSHPWFVIFEWREQARHGLRILVASFRERAADSVEHDPPRLHLGRPPPPGVDCRQPAAPRFQPFPQRWNATTRPPLARPTKKYLFSAGWLLRFPQPTSHARPFPALRHHGALRVQQTDRFS